MDRRTFLKRSGWLALGGLVVANAPSLAQVAVKAEELRFDGDLYALFKSPTMQYRPFIRWWWIGNKVNEKELVRQLRFLKEAGLGGVEIYPVGFPKDNDDAGIPSLHYLSDEWIRMLQVTFDEAKRLDMTCDLMVGTGWPYAGDWVPREDRAQVALIHAEPVTGPRKFEMSRFAIFKKVDPESTVPVETRTFEILSLTMAPDPLDRMGQVVDLNDQRDNEMIEVDVPAGPHYIYALVRVRDFAAAINGAPGGDGPFIDHYKEGTVRRYMAHMTDTIEAKIGPLAPHIRSYLTDSMELEGSNWTDDMPELFQAKYGYDLMPYLPLLLWKVHRLGDVHEYSYGSKKSPELQETLDRVRYDFELLRAELLDERYTKVYTDFCREKGIKSKGQAYGRGFFSLESSLRYDIPEGESWTTNYLKHRLGEEMSNEDYRLGRGYVMINKYVSSAAHLNGKRLISSEEMTNTYHLFNATFELFKVGSDQSAMSGITQSIWHGFNYSPPEAPYPGWILYGSYYNENNNWWPYFHHFNAYRARLQSVLQNADMHTDIALLTAIPDMWTQFGVQTDPFPGPLAVPYTSLVWEAINKNGGGCDYTSEIVIGRSTVRNGALCYGAKAYKHLFLVGIDGIEVDTLKKIHAFVQSGGRVFCIERYPGKSLGYVNYEQRDREVREWVDKLKQFPDRFILLDKPADNNFLDWYTDVQQKYKLPNYLKIEKPNPYLMQNRYRTDDGSEVVLICYAHRHDPHTTRLTFAPEIVRGRTAWLWDPRTGERYLLPMRNGSCEMSFGPTDERLIVFDRKRAPGEVWKPLPTTGSGARALEGWEVELTHSREGWTKKTRMQTPVDLKETEWVDFSGTVSYKKEIDVDDPAGLTLNLGKVHGVSDVRVNGREAGVQWAGYRLYDLTPYLKPGRNEIEVRVVTTMGNYMKTLKENPVAQKWTVNGSKDQPIQSMGLDGPVTLYKR